MVCMYDTYSYDPEQTCFGMFDNSGKSDSDKDVYYLNHNSYWDTISVSITYNSNSIRVYASGIWPSGADFAYVVWG